MLVFELDGQSIIHNREIDYVKFSTVDRLVTTEPGQHWSHDEVPALAETDWLILGCWGLPNEVYRPVGKKPLSLASTTLAQQIRPKGRVSSSSYWTHRASEFQTGCQPTAPEALR